MDNKISNKAIFSFFAFLIAIVKDFAFTYAKIIPERSPINYVISYLVVFPVLVVGLIFSIQTLKKAYHMRRVGEKFSNINILLSMPTLLCFLYGAISLLFIIIVLF